MLNASRESLGGKNGMAAGTATRMISALSLVAALLLTSRTALADPMKCSNENKTCISNCQKKATTRPSVCLTECGARQSYCIKTGCWDNGVQRYCGLSKQ